MKKAFHPMPFPSTAMASVRFAVLVLLIEPLVVLASPLYSLTGTYSITVDGTNITGVVPVTGPSSNIIPDTVHSYSGPAPNVSGIYGLVLTDYAEIFGDDATYDVIHCCYIAVSESISALYTMDVSSLLVKAHFDVTDTIMPTSNTLQAGSPEEFLFTTWAEGAFDDSGTICQGEVGGGVIAVNGPGGSVSATGCPTGGNFFQTKSTEVTLFSGQGYTFSWSVDESLGSAIGYYINGLSRGTVLRGQHTDFLQIQPLTPGAGFVSASGALYQGPIPEPSPLLLVGAACSCLFIRVRRSRSQKY